jgi:hypothetical protein
MMEWPAGLSDRIFLQIMKDRVEKIQVDNIVDGRVTIMETWMGLDQNYMYMCIDSLVESMQRRITQCRERLVGLLTSCIVKSVVVSN